MQEEAAASDEREGEFLKESAKMRAELAALVQNLQEIEALNARIAAMRKEFSIVATEEKELSKKLLALDAETERSAAVMAGILAALFEATKISLLDDKTLAVRAARSLNSFSQTLERLIAIEKAQTALEEDISRQSNLAATAESVASRLRKELETAEASLEQAEKLLRDAERDCAAAALSSQLADGDSCPVCGGKYFTASKSASESVDIELFRKNAQQAKTLVRTKLNELQVAAAASAAAVSSWDSLQKKKIELETDKNILLKKVDEELGAEKTTLDKKADFAKQLEAVRLAETEIERALRTRSEAQYEREGLEKELKNAELKISTISAQGKEQRTLLDGLMKLIEGKPQSINAAETAAADLDGQIAAATKRAEQRRAAIAKEQAELACLQADLAGGQGKLSQIIEALKETRVSSEISEEKLRELTEKAKEAQDNCERLLGEIAATESDANRLKSDLERKNLLEQDKKAADKRLALFDNLYSLVKAKKFVSFLAAEKISLITERASNRLSSLTNGGFELDYDDSFSVIDNFNGGTTRSIETLSGGETFLASLSLALAISEEISLDKAIEFFFLDEGFGTLDSELINIVANAFERLREEKLTIGLISHRAELMRRIDKKLELLKTDKGTVVV